MYIPKFFCKNKNFPARLRGIVKNILKTQIKVGRVIENDSLKKCFTRKLILTIKNYFTKSVIKIFISQY